MRFFHYAQPSLFDLLAKNDSRIREIDSSSHYGHNPVSIPAEAGATNTFDPVFKAFVVPPSGGNAHNENCWEIEGVACVSTEQEFSDMQNTPKDKSF